MRIGRFVSGLGTAALVTWSASGALRPGISHREAAVFRWFNDGPDVIETPVWFVTQAGSLGSVITTAALVRRSRGTHDAPLVLAVGTAVWIGAKLIKPAIGRGRPDRYLDSVRYEAGRKPGSATPRDTRPSQRPSR